MRDPGAAALLDRWASHGVLDDAVPVCLYLYAGGALPAPDLQNRIRAKTGRLAPQLELLARKLTDFNATEIGTIYGQLLEELSRIEGTHPGLNTTSDAIYRSLPNLLSVFAARLRVLTQDGPVVKPPGRKLAESRAITLLVLWANTRLQQPESQSLDEVTALLQVACQAAGVERDVDVESVKKRIHRLRTGHPKDYAFLKGVLAEVVGFPARADTLLVLILMPPKYVALLRTDRQ